MMILILQYICTLLKLNNVPKKLVMHQLRKILEGLKKTMLELPHDVLGLEQGRQFPQLVQINSEGAIELLIQLRQEARA
jgi:hypothetical protein